MVITSEISETGNHIRITSYELLESRTVSTRACLYQRQIWIESACYRRVEILNRC